MDSVKHITQLILNKWPILENLELVSATTDQDYAYLQFSDKLLFKAPLHAGAHKKFLVEKHLLQHLGVQIDTLSPVKVPLYSYIDPDSGISGAATLPGEALTVELFNSLSDARKINIAKEIGAFLYSLHNLDSYLTPEEENLDFLKKAQTLKEKYSFLDLPKKHVAALAQPCRLVVNHCNLQAHNLFYKASDAHQFEYTLGVVNFSDAKKADAAIDYSFLWEYGDIMLKEVTRAYRLMKEDTVIKSFWAYLDRTLNICANDAQNRYNQVLPTLNELIN